MMVGNLCIIEDNGKMLMKLATRGVIKGRWNFPGGKVENGETSEESTVREVREETGLTVSNLVDMGKLNFYDGSEAFFSVDVYAAGSFSGTVRESEEEGPLKWFDRSALPLDRMSSADRFWVPLVLDGKRILGEFHFRNKSVDVLSEHRVTVLDKAL